MEECMSANRHQRKWHPSSKISHPPPQMTRHCSHTRRHHGICLTSTVIFQDECLKLHSLKSREDFFLTFPRDSFMYVEIELMYWEKRGNKPFHWLFFSHVWNILHDWLSHCLLRLTSWVSITEFWHFPHRFSGPCIFPVRDLILKNPFRKQSGLELGETSEAPLTR